MITDQLDFHSVQNVARSTIFCNLIGCSKKRSQKVEINPTFLSIERMEQKKGITNIERATYCIEWKSTLSALKINRKSDLQSFSIGLDATLVHDVKMCRTNLILFRLCW